MFRILEGGSLIGFYFILALLVGKQEAACP